MKEEAIILFAILAIGLGVPIGCLFVCYAKAALRGFAAMGVIICATFIPKVFATGSTKPPTPPPQPPAEDVKVEVVNITTRGLTIHPIVSAIMMDGLYGKRCEVQIKRDDSQTWEVVAVIDSYDLTPRVIPGVYVSGGARTIRRLRLYWPEANREMELNK